MLIFKLAFKNLLGAGMRTWLNVVVLSFSYLIIIFFNGLIDGWNQQARRDTMQWEVGQGQLWHTRYDPYDPFSYPQAHGSLPGQYKEKGWVPVLLTQGTVYPQGRMLSVNLRGIPTDQTVTELPTTSLLSEEGVSERQLPAIIGARMAQSAHLKEGDQVMVRWRDQHGTYDARMITIVAIFHTTVAAVDQGQVWLSLNALQEMTDLQNQATYLIADQNFKTINDHDWRFQTPDDLLRNLDAIIQSKKASGAIMYLLLLGMALLAIFDTQVLSIFRRQKEIGTYIALGMTRGQVVSLFTLEGAAHSLLAAVVGAIYGTPLLWLLARKGYGIPSTAGDMGVAMADRIYPVFSLMLILGTILLVVVSATVVSYLPSRKISHMNPTLALKGKLQ